MKTPGAALTLAAGLLALSCRSHSEPPPRATRATSQPAAAPAATPTSPSPCVPNDFCRPEAVRAFMSVGYPCDPPILLERVDPDLGNVAKPHPQGFVIMEIGIGTRGEVVSACVLRGVRPDFDCAAQAAMRKWRYTSPRFWGEPVGLRATVAVRAPAPDPSAAAPTRPAPRRSFPHPACK